MGQIEGDAGHRGGRVGTNSRQSADGVDSSGEASQFCDRDGGATDISGSRVVAEPAPGSQDLALRSACQRLNIGEAAEELLVERDGCGCARLLQHDFR